MNGFRDRFGRRDPDLSPAHDAMMCWLDHQLRDRKWSPRCALDFNDPTKRDKFINDLPEWQRPFILGQLPSLAAARLQRIEWEYIVPPDSADGRLPMAFVDVVAWYEIEFINRQYFDKDGRSIDSERVKYPTWQQQTRRIELNKITTTEKIGFELKPAIVSIGELLRQIKSYEKLDPKVWHWVVVSPANELAQKAVRREGFGWLTAPDQAEP